MKDTKKPELATSIYGLFDQSGTIEGHINFNQAVTNLRANILSVGYMIASNSNKTLYLHENFYNLNDIRKELNLYSGTNADLVLELIEKAGVKACRKLNGKYTIILCEREKTTIIRDRNGEGKMIYFTDGYFTDSYQGLMNFKNFVAAPDLTGITTFLKIGYIPAPVTSLKGVSKIPAGEILVVSKTEKKFEKLFSFDEILNTKRNPVTEAEATEEYSHLLEESLTRRIGNADSIGVLLSGGYDSGGNIALARKVYSGKIKTYSIGFKDNPASELPYARMMAEKFGAEHHEYVMDGSEIEFLPEIIDALGDPFSESGFMLNHSVMKMVSSENLPVVIGGDGNDQYFGAGIRETAIHYKLRKSGLAAFSKLFDQMSNNMLFDNDNLAYRIKYQNQKFLKVMEPETFGFPDFQLCKMFDLKSIPSHEYLAVIPEIFGSYEELFLQRNYYLHLQHAVNEVILFKASRMSEFFKVNLSFSYTDLEIYDFLQRLPINLRAKGTVNECLKGKGVSKYIHKKLVKPMLPDAVTNRPKQGGFSPLEIFFNTPERRKAIYKYIRNSAFAATMKNKDFLDQFFVQYEALASGKLYWFWHKQVKSNQLINLLIVAIWWDRTIKNIRKTGLSGYIGN